MIYRVCDVEDCGENATLRNLSARLALIQGIALILTNHPVDLCDSHAENLGMVKTSPNGKGD